MQQQKNWRFVLFSLRFSLCTFGEVYYTLYNNRFHERDNRNDRNSICKNRNQHKIILALYYIDQMRVSFECEC